MVRKKVNKWIMPICIALVALLITPSIAIAFEGALIDEKVEEEPKEEIFVECTPEEPDESAAETPDEEDPRTGYGTYNPT